MEKNINQENTGEELQVGEQIPIEKKSIFKKIIIITVFLVIVGSFFYLTGGKPGNITPTVLDTIRSSSNKEYSSDDGLFSLKYRDDWVIEEQLEIDANLRVVTILSPRYGVAIRGNFREGVSIIYGEMDSGETGYSANSFADEIHKAELSDFIDSGIISDFKQEEDNISGVSFKIYSYNVQDTPTEVRFTKEVIGTKDGRLIWMTFTDSTEESAVSERIFDRMVDSLVIN